MERGRSRWMTKRMSGLSIPMPNATVATTTSMAPAWNASWTLRAHLRLEAGVVRRGADAVVAQELGGVLDGLARQRVDDPALAAPRADEPDDGVARRGAPRPSSPRGAAGSGGGTSRARGAGRSIPSWPAMSRVTSGVAVAVSASTGAPKRALQAREVPVRGAEVVAPVADAVRLVHRDERRAACPRARSRPTPRAPRARRRGARAPRGAARAPARAAPRPRGSS